MENAEAQLARFKSNVAGIYVGVNVQAITFGLASLVTIAYFRLPRKADPRWVRSLILVAWTLCAFCAAINFYTLYYFLVTTLSLPADRIWAPWSLSVLIVVVACVSTVVRLLLLYRLARFHYYKADLPHWLVFVIALVAVLSIVGLAGGIGITIRLLLPITRAVVKLKIIFDLLLACAIAADILFVCVQSYSLHRSRSGFQRTDSVINILILYTMSTGLIPTAFALATLISMFLAPEALVYAILYMQVGNLYLITLAASLNHREAVSERMARPMDLNYSVFGRLAPPDNEAQPSPLTAATAFPELRYADAPQTGSFVVVPLQATAKARENPSCSSHGVIKRDSSYNEPHVVDLPAGEILAQTGTPFDIDSGVISRESDYNHQCIR